MAEEPIKTNCPSCLGPAVKEGDVIVCEKCDATFTFTKTGGAKVKEIGRIDAVEKRLDRLDLLWPVQEPDPAELEPDPAKLEPNPANKETSILGPE